MHLVDGAKPPHTPGVYYLRGERRCGRGATAARFLPRADGAWVCIPICEECARALGTTA
jgi:hypothetical protein